jgi:hypothetical protein
MRAPAKPPASPVARGDGWRGSQYRRPANGAQRALAGAGGLSSRTGRMTCTVEAGVAGAHLVTIAGRAFELGMAYASAIPPAKAADGPRVPRRLVSLDPGFGWPGGLVVAELLEAPVSGRKPRRLRLSGEGWAAWAGELVEETGGR